MCTINLTCYYYHIIPPLWQFAKDSKRTPLTGDNLCKTANSIRSEESLQTHQVHVVFILEGIVKLWDPGAAVQSQDAPLNVMTNPLENSQKNIAVISAQ